MDMVERLPKVDLHIHLDGSVRPETIRDIAAAEGVPLPAADLDELRRYLQVQDDCTSLPEYLSKFDLPVSCMQSEAALIRIAREIVEDASARQVQYIEVRFAPSLHTRQGLSLEKVIGCVLAGLEEGERATGTKARAIIICMRNHSPSYNESVVQAASPFLGKGVVAMDLAGDEVHYPPEAHREVFRLAHSLGFPVTIHAGEAAGAGHIREAIASLHACRIGHGVRLREDQELLQVIIQKGIPLEMCLSSNIQTKAVAIPGSHPIKEYYDQGIKVTINTDNTTVSHTDMNKEIKKAMELFSFTLSDMAAIMLNGVDASYLEDHEKEQLLKKFKQAYAGMGIPGY